MGWSILTVTPSYRILNIFCLVKLKKLLINILQKTYSSFFTSRTTNIFCCLTLDKSYCTYVTLHVLSFSASHLFRAGLLIHTVARKPFASAANIQLCQFAELPFTSFGAARGTDDPATFPHAQNLFGMRYPTVIWRPSSGLT